VKMRAATFGLLPVWLLTNPLSLVRAEQDETGYDIGIRVVKYETMNYPDAAGMDGREGVVGVRVKLDRQGKVVDSMASSGDELLRVSCLDNAKKWRFETNSQNATILVYYSRLLRIPASCGADYVPQINSYPPNFVSVTGCGFTAYVQPH
jgi:TonB family protein